jgi:hypothetical protein
MKKCSIGGNKYIKDYGSNDAALGCFLWCWRECEAGRIRSVRLQIPGDLHAVLTTRNRFPFWRPCGRKQISVSAWQARKQFSVLAILAGVVVLATEKVFLFGTSETVFCFGNSAFTGNDDEDNNEDSVVDGVNGRIWLGLRHQPEPYSSHLLM